MIANWSFLGTSPLTTKVSVVSDTLSGNTLGGSTCSWHTVFIGIEAAPWIVATLEWQLLVEHAEKNKSRPQIIATFNYIHQGSVMLWAGPQSPHKLEHSTMHYMFVCTFMHVQLPVDVESVYGWKESEFTPVSNYRIYIIVDKFTCANCWHHDMS